MVLRHDDRSPQSAPARALDLNLFRVLEAIHVQGGISAAARSLHVSQPAVSHALRRLREAFADPLFVRHGNRMLPTELTRRVMGDVQAHLRGLGAVLHSAQAFEPAMLELTFRLAVRDVMEAITFPRLMEQLWQAAPGVSVTSRRVPREALERELSGGHIDLAIERKTRLGPRIRGVKLVEESLAVVTRRPERPAAARRPTLATYLRARHVVVAQSTPASSQDVGTVLPLAVHEPPFAVPALEIMMYWHADRDADPAHRWLREMVQSGAEQVIRQTNRRR
jgi:DNA-binding transcriptional LysR family regulator